MTLTRERVLEILGAVPDPEVPVISVVELGIVRDATVAPDGGVAVTITPTYSGCPAMEVIEQRVEAALAQRGVPATIRRVLSPPWTTDWLSEEGRRKLREFGIAPPGRRGLDLPVACPRCRSLDTGRVSEFGSTPCKSAWRCNACLEPFEHFKCI